MRSRKKRETSIAAALWFLTILTASAAAACFSADAISPERAVIERAAIHHDLRNDSATLFVIASKRAKLLRPDLADRTVNCAISDIQTTFSSETHARHTITYVCGVPPWRLNRDPAVATPTIALDLLKEGPGIWVINGFP
jgi:hypothetical protein